MLVCLYDRSEPCMKIDVIKSLAAKGPQLSRHWAATENVDAWRFITPKGHQKHSS
jgi:hypothetical protein